MKVIIAKLTFLRSSKVKDDDPLQFRFGNLEFYFCMSSNDAIKFAINPVK